MDSLEKAGQDVDGINEDQIMERRRVGDNNPPLASKAQAAQGRALTLQVFPCVIQPDLMSFQESVERVTSLETKKLPQLRFRQTTGLVLPQCKCFKCTAREIAR